MPESIGGGQSLSHIYRVKKNTAGNAYEILAGLSGTSLAEDTADVALNLTEIADTKVSPQDDGTVKVSYDNYQDDEAWLAFLDAVNPPTAAAASSRPEWKKENSVKKGGSSGSSDNLVLDIIYGAFNEAGTKIKVTALLGSVSRTSNSFSQKADDWSKPTFEITGVKAEFDLPISATLFDTGTGGLIDATSVTSLIPKITKNAGFAIKFVAKHA